MITLAVEASTYSGSVAILESARVRADRTAAMKGSEHERLMPAVAAVLDEAGLAAAEIHRVVCGAGPGSFTSLRIAGGIAKGIAAGVGCPLFAVPSLALIVASAALPPGPYLAAIDALRGQLYVGLYERDDDGEVHEVDTARVIDAERVDTLVAQTGARLVGPSHGGLVPHARGVARLATMLRDRGPVDVATWEPTYGRLAEAQVRWESAHGRPLPMT